MYYNNEIYWKHENLNLKKSFLKVTKASKSNETQIPVMERLGSVIRER